MRRVRSLLSIDTALCLLFFSIILGFVFDSRIFFEGVGIIVALLCMRLSLSLVCLVFICFQFLVNGPSFSTFQLVYVFFLLALCLNKLSLKRESRLRYSKYFALACSSLAAVLVIDSWSSLRPVGMFNSPTSLGVFSVAIYMLYGGVLKYLGGLIAILTGSRGVALILISLFSIRRLVVIIVGLVVVVSGLMLFSNDLVPRSFSVGGASDTGRLLSFDKVAELRFGFWDVLFGHGRQSFGSLGQWESGYAVVVESSVFTWFLSYGFGLMTPVFVLFFYGLYRQRSLVLSMLLFVGIVSVTLDALAVTLILYLAVYRRQRARYLNAYVVR